MGSSLEDFALEAMTAIVGHNDINEFLINKLVNRARNRPHPWSTGYSYICWSGLTDRTYDARLLPAKPYPAAEAPGTRKPPIDDLVALFAAPATGQAVCPKSTCLFPAFAQYLTDGFLRTMVHNDPPYGDGMSDRKRTTSNHEIDMSALYGRTSAQTRVLRLRSEQKGQKGRLLTQTLGGEEFPLHLFGPDGKVQAQFCDTAGTPILDTPLGVHTDTPGLATLFAVGGDRANANPQVAMMNTLFLREHNRMARLIETHNPAWEDERVFQVARNNLIVMFIKIVVEEYINHINTSVFKFIADPRVAWKAKWNRPNWMTAEFSLLYRWHSLVPENLKLNGANVPGTTMLLDNSWLTQRGLANAFVEISANNATRLGIGNSASFLVSVEKKAINQARENEIATYNDYRVAMGLDRAKDFGDIVGKTSDKPENTRRTALAAQLKRLYGSVDNVEYYVGLFVEPPQKNGPLPELIMAMVAMDAFSQALTNPLLSEHVYGDHRVETFTAEGLVEIEATKRLRDVLVRNSSGVADRFVGMTRADWRRK